ncbi:MAG: hypothetical protein HXY34_08205 [Candidatus Thorarchaeota archaeon]|nr:hypothetical protein [Candidatus Thorarchaeota archaeon]
MTSASRNKYFIATLTISIVLAGMTFNNLPGPMTTLSVQVIDGVVYNFADYPYLSHEQIGLFNYIDSLVTGQGYGSWNGWNAPEEFHGLLHYVLAFMAYATASFFESTPGYRTSAYHNFAYSLIKRMNTTVAEYGNNSIEYTEWMHPSYNFVEYYWPDPSNSSGLYMGGFRGPANIMWTGHYALMMALYERNFNTGLMTDELSWFVADWNNSLTTDGYGHADADGIWNTGLIPCEPYIVFVQCNSIPMYCTVLYDNLYGTHYFEDGMWDYGLYFINNVMQDQYGLFTDGYYTMKPMGYVQPTEGPAQPFPGLSQDRYIRDGRPKVSSYCNGWALTFLEYIQENETRHDYPVFLEHFGKEISNDQMYMLDTYNNQRGFGTFDMLGTLFTMALAKQQGDFHTLQRLYNFVYSPYNKIWSQDGRSMHFDTSAALPFLQVPLAFGSLWATTPVTVRMLADARPTEFWSYPYISQADDENIWIYQAVWDSQKSAFILNIQVDRPATLRFDNFAHTPRAYSGGAAIAELSAVGGGHTLTLQPGTYNLVIR